HVKIAREAVQISREKIQSKKYDIVILDEINYAVNLGLVEVNDVLDLIKIKPSTLHLVLTGNYASDEIINAADLVTEMKEIKHPFQVGIKAKKGIDY
ncbi:MAG: cob(I)yrinic acid a,c-diamide adenosyltransferase, partial [Nitrosopumilaceae archaeon]|nr:cob(I)yrinic acid a,c-diamide adenosyltransferase [Nitrosopumilaceae archaeon]